jgi:hypothetical protein
MNYLLVLPFMVIYVTRDHVYVQEVLHDMMVVREDIGIFLGLPYCVLGAYDPKRHTVSVLDNERVRFDGAMFPLHAISSLLSSPEATYRLVGGLIDEEAGFLVHDPRWAMTVLHTAPISQIIP